MTPEERKALKNKWNAEYMRAKRKTLTECPTCGLPITYGGLYYHKKSHRAVEEEAKKAREAAIEAFARALALPSTIPQETVS